MLTRVLLTSSHKATGQTKHSVGEEPVAEPAELRVVQYLDDPGYYLIHYDLLGSELADTYHDSVAEALRQAQWEFNIREEEWEDI